MVIATPVDDTSFNVFGLEVLGERFTEERREFAVGGEAEGNELFDGELVDVGAFFGGEKSGEAEAFFEADDTVLCSETSLARDASHYEEDGRHEDPPKVKSPVSWPVVNGDVDGEDKIEQEYRQNEEVKRRVPACMVLEVLCWGHDRILSRCNGSGASIAALVR